MRVVGIALILLLLLLTGSVPAACGPREVKFPDPGLEAYIRGVIKKPEGAIFPSDLTEITKIHIGGDYFDSLPPVFSDLTGLEYCVNLNILYLEGYKIRDLSPVAGLTKLTVVFIQYGEISDLSPLAGLTNLTGLGFPFNEISDISPLASLTNLTTLYLDYNKIVDISPLTSLTSLKTLSLFYNPLSNASVNIYIPQLKERGVQIDW